jgi:hypothetical protein
MPSAYIVYILLSFIMENSNKFVGSEVLTAVIMKSAVLWDVTPCASFVGYFTMLSAARLYSAECQDD